MLLLCANYIEISLFVLASQNVHNYFKQVHIASFNVLIEF